MVLRALPFLIGLAALSCGGCSLSDAIAGGRAKGDAHAVTVKATDAADAWPLAILHCSAFSKSAQFVVAEPGGKYRYRCL
jgi:hypothetical protein